MWPVDVTRTLATYWCSIVTTAALERGDRLRLQDATDQLTDTTSPRYVLVPATPALIAATNYWGVVKLADIP